MSNVVAYIATGVIMVLSILLALAVTGSGLFPPIEQLGFYWVAGCAVALFVFLTKQRVWLTVPVRSVG